MERFAKYVIGASIVLFLVSCATAPEIETNKNPAYSGVITKLFIVVDVGDWTYTYYVPQSGTSNLVKKVLLGDYLKENLEKTFQANGIDTKATRITGLELGSDQLTKEIYDFGGDRLMSVQLSQGTYYSDQELRTGTFDVAIFDSSDKNVEHYPVVWRGKVTTDSGFSVEEVIQSILSGLKTDELVKPAPAKSN